MPQAHLQWTPLGCPALLSLSQGRPPHSSQAQIIPPRETTVEETCLPDVGPWACDPALRTVVKRDLGAKEKGK